MNLFYCGIFFISQNWHFFQKWQQSNARAGQKKKHFFFRNVGPKSNVRTHLKQRKKTKWPYLIYFVFDVLNTSINSLICLFLSHTTCGGQGLCMPWMSCCFSMHLSSFLFPIVHTHPLGGIDVTFGCYYLRPTFSPISLFMPWKISTQSKWLTLLTLICLIAGKPCQIARPLLWNCVVSGRDMP